MERLHILDGYGYVFRAFYGLSAGGPGRAGVRLSTAAGMPTGALFVYARMLIRLYRDVKPERIAVVFDAPGRTFRDDIDGAYKATRRETPEDLKPQLPYFPALTEAFCWPTLSVPGVEADDVIATLVCRARERGWDVTVYSGDKDLMQLVDEHVTVVDAMRNLTYGPAEVAAKFGVAPGQIRDYLALVGDTSDNVAGMPGVGKVTAAKLLGEHGSIDGILAHVDQLKGKLRDSFRDPALREQLERSRQLVTLRSDVDVPVELDALAPLPWDGRALTELFQKLEFQSLLAELGASGQGSGQKSSPTSRRANGQKTGQTHEDGHEAADAVHDEPDGPGAAGALAALAEQPVIADPVVIFAPAELEPLLGAARRARTLAVQVETDGARPDRARVIGIGLAAPECAPVYVPLAHRYLSVPAQLAVADLPPELVAMLADPEIAKVCHDGKSARRALASLGIALEGIAADTMLAAYLLDPDRELSLERVLAGAAAIKLPPKSALLGKGRTRIDFEAVPVEHAAAYAAVAAAAVLCARDELDRRLAAAGLSKLMNELELPLAIVLADMEQVGICLDVAYLGALSDRVAAQIAAIERRVYELAGGEINIGSPKQLASLLFDKLGLVSDKMKKTKTGYSTDHEVLESLIEAHEIVAPILEHRELIKLKGTYIDALPPLLSPRTGRIHTSFNQAVAATGRLSSQDPNLQNIPIRSELGREIRRAFVAAEGKVLVSVDYSQIELRILAHLSGDPVLTRAFRDDIDVHTQTAAEVFGIALADVGANERRVAKAVNYGLVYGQSEFGLARALGIPRADARHYITRYFERFATVREYMKTVIAGARQTGAVTTILGRRRPIPDITAKNYQRRAAAERVAQNTPMQGSAADIMKLAMLRVAGRMARERFDATMLLTVHDELVFEVAPDQADAFAAVVADEMERAYELTVPLKASVGKGRTWADAH